MARVREYNCEKCDYSREEYMNDTGEIPFFLTGEKCPECGGRLALSLNAKSNGQRYYHNDRNY